MSDFRLFLLSGFGLSRCLVFNSSNCMILAFLTVWSFTLFAVWFLTVLTVWCLTLLTVWFWTRLSVWFNSSLSLFFHSSDCVVLDSTRCYIITLVILAFWLVFAIEFFPLCFKVSGRKERHKKDKHSFLRKWQKKDSRSLSQQSSEIKPNTKLVLNLLLCINLSYETIALSRI